MCGVRSKLKNNSLTKEDVAAWLDSVVGRSVMERIAQWRQNELEGYVRGSVVVDGNAVATSMRAVELSTKIKMYDMFINLADEFFVGENED